MTTDAGGSVRATSPSEEKRSRQVSIRLSGITRSRASSLWEYRKVKQSVNGKKKVGMDRGWGKFMIREGNGMERE